MRLKYNTTAKGKCYYIIRSVYKNGRNTSETVEKLGYVAVSELTRDEYRGVDIIFMEKIKRIVEEKLTKLIVPIRAVLGTSVIKVDEFVDLQVNMKLIY